MGFRPFYESTPNNGILKRVATKCRGHRKATGTLGIINYLNLDNEVRNVGFHKLIIKIKRLFFNWAKKKNK